MTGAMTVLELANQLQELLWREPQTAFYQVVLVPHGRDPRQELATIHQQLSTVLLEARQ